MIAWRSVLHRKLLREVWARKGSLLALAAVVAIGVACYIGMASTFRDLKGSRDRYYANYRLADFTVDCKRAPDFLAEELAALPNVSSVRGRASTAVLVDLPHLIEPISGTAISMPERREPVINDVLIRTGSWFSGRNEKEVILNDAFARAHELMPGHRIRVLLLDCQHDLLVVGTAMSPEFVYLIPPSGGLAPDPAKFGVMYLTEDFLRRSCDLEGAWNQWVGKAHDASRGALDRSLTRMEDILEPYGVTNTTPVQEQPSARFIADEIQGLEVSTTITPTLFLGVAALILNVLMGRMVAQQRPVVGTLRALGYTRGAVILHFLCFGLVLGLGGGLSGLVMGLWFESSMTEIYQQFYALPSIEPHFYPDILIKGVAISLFFALLGTIRGARAAARLAPAEAMRPPPPEKGGRILIERIPAIWARMPFRGKLILRTVFRNPFRTSVAIVASMVSTALIVSSFCMVDALEYLIQYEFVRVSHQDHSVSLRDPRDQRVAEDLLRLPAVGQAEVELNVVCDLSRGSRSKRIGVTGLSQDAQLHTPLNAAGERVKIPQQGLVLTRKLGEILAAAPGDTVRLRPLIGRRQEVEAPVVAIADTFLGLSAYAEMGYLSRLLGEDRSANLLLTKNHEGDGPDALMTELKKRPAVVGVGERARSLSQLEETFGQVNGTMLWVMVIFAGTIAFGSVLNAALVSLSEREREVGTFRVLGYTPTQITWIFAGESFLLNGVGTVLGLGAGVGLAALLSTFYNTELYRFPLVVTPQSLLLALVLMGLFVSVAQVMVLRLVRGLPWLDVLKVKE